MPTQQRTTTVQEVPVTSQTTTTTVETVNQPVVAEDGTNFIIDKIAQVIYVIFTILNILLITRFVLLFLGANRVGFVNFIYDITAPFVAPFIGIFGRQTVFGVGYIEWEIIVAIIFYSFVAWALVEILSLFKTKTV